MNLKLFENGFGNHILTNNLGIIKPIIYNLDYSKVVSYTNPSIYNDNGNLRMILRGVDYSFFHSRSNRYSNWDGPLQYIHPENDVTLKTWNYLVDLTPDLQISNFYQINMIKSTPKWSFIGLEDARLFRWDGKLYICGVRRDADEKGTGRMELSEITLNGDQVNEKSRLRIEVPESNPSDFYCEKNWMPILDKPYHFIRYSNPTQVIKVDQYGNTKIIPELSKSEAYNDTFLRGNTQVIPYKDYYIAFVHSVKIWKPESGSKDSVYSHRIIIWDKEFNILAITKDFQLLNFNIEFSCGLCIDNEGKFLLSTSTDDSASFIIKFDPDPIINLILDTYGNR